MVFSYGLSVEEAPQAKPTAQAHMSSLVADSNAMAPSTSAPSQYSMEATHGSESGSNEGPQRGGRFINMGLSNEQLVQMQAAIQQKQLQAKSYFENQAPSRYPPPDFTKLLYPVERLPTRRDLSVIPSACWEAIGSNICFLCAVPSHFYDECPLYPGQMPGTNQCGCSGFHLSECRVNLRPLMDHPSRNGWFVPQPPPKREGQNGGQVQDPSQYPNPNRYRGGGQGGQGGPVYGQAYQGGNIYNNVGNNGNRYQGNNNHFNNGGQGGPSRYQGPRGDGNGNGRNNYGFPNQNSAHGGGVPMGMQGPTMGNMNQSGHAPNRAGGSLGNSGSQAVPLAAIMNPAQVQPNN